MKVRELIAELQKLDPELMVIKQKDDEGNGYHKMYVVDDDAYIENDSFDQYYLEVLSTEDLEDYEYDPADYTQVCVIV